MTRAYRIVVSTAIAGAAGLVAVAQPVALVEGHAAAPTHLIVKVRNGVDMQPFEEGPGRIGNGPVPTAVVVLQQSGAVASRPLYPAGFAMPGIATGIGLDRTFVADIGEDAALTRVLASLRARPDVFEWVEPDYIVYATDAPNDTHYTRQWALENTGQLGGSVDADIDAESAWTVSTGSSGIRVAILDSGIVAGHTEFEGRVIARNFTSSDPGAWGDDNSHGTHVAGIAAARGGNERGIAGVCWNCTVVVGRVLNAAGSGTDSQAAQGLEWAVSQGARVVNMSFSSSVASNTLEDAVLYAFQSGCLLVASSGNRGSGEPEYPAAFDAVVAVGNTTDRDVISSTSSYGEHLYLSAPGTSIWSTLPNGDYGYKSGTSMAAPHVSGLAGLVLSVNPSLPPGDVGTILALTADDLGAPARDQYYGYGRINAGRAMAAVSFPGAWVDFGFAGAGVGTFVRPYNNLVAGINAVPNGGQVMLKSGSAGAVGVITKPVTLRAWSGTVTIGG